MYTSSVVKDERRHGRPFTCKMQENDDLLDHIYKVTILKTMLTKKLTMEYVMPYLMHKNSKREENELQGNDATMVFHQGEGNNLSSYNYMKFELLLHGILHVFLLQDNEQEHEECEQL